MRERAPGLTPVRLAIDGVDDGLVLLLAARRACNLIWIKEWPPAMAA